MTSKDKKLSNLFAGICFYLNDSLTPTIRETVSLFIFLHAFHLANSRYSLQLCDTLIKGGAKQCLKPVLNSITNSTTTPTSSTLRRFDETFLTHFITDSLDFPEHALLHELNGQVEGSSADDGGEIEVKIAIVTVSFSLDVLLSV